MNAMLLPTPREAVHRRRTPPAARRPTAADVEERPRRSATSRPKRDVHELARGLGARPATGKQARKAPSTTRHERGRHAQTPTAFPMSLTAPASHRPGRAQRRARNPATASGLGRPAGRRAPSAPSARCSRHTVAEPRAPRPGSPRYRYSDDSGGKPAVLVQQRTRRAAWEGRAPRSAARATSHAARNGAFDPVLAPARAASSPPLRNTSAGRYTRPQHQILSHVAQDVRQLHGHAQRHAVLAQPLAARGRVRVQERQQHEPDRPCHVVGVLLQVVQGGRLPEPQVAPLPLQIRS